MKNETPDVWLGLRCCGCAVAVVVDDPDHRKDTEASKREFLRDGLSVVSATWDEWLNVYRPKFLANCEHQKATAKTEAVADTLPFEVKA